MSNAEKGDMPSIKKNLIYNTAYQVLTILLPFITAPYVARVLGADGVGIQSYTQSIQTYFIMFASLGTLTYGTKEISQHRNDAYQRSKLFWEIELMTVGTSAISLAVWFCFIAFSSQYRIYYLVLTIGIVAALFDISWFFSGLEEFRLIAVRNIILKLAGVVCLFLFVKEEGDLLKYILILTMTDLVAALSVWPYLRKHLVHVPIRELQIRHHFKETLLFFVPTIAVSVYTVLDKTLIGLITRDSAQNGYYQYANYVIISAKSVVFMAVNTVLGSRSAFLFAEKRYDEMKDGIRNSMNYIFFTGFACCFGIMAVARTFVPVFLGPGYEPVEYLLYIFSPILIIIGISNCLDTQYFTPSGRRGQSNKFIITGAIVNFCLNLILISKFGAYGAAAASIIAEILITYLHVHFSGDFGRVPMLFHCGLKKGIAGLVMFLIVFQMNQLTINGIVLLVIQVLAGAAIYFVLLFLMRDSWTVDFVRPYIRKITGRIGHRE